MILYLVYCSSTDDKGAKNTSTSITIVVIAKLTDCAGGITVVVACTSAGDAKVD